MAVIVNGAEQGAVFHSPFRVAPVKLTFELELDDGDSLMHLGDETQGFVAQVLSFIRFGQERPAFVACIRLHGKGGEGHHVDAIALFERLRVGVTQRKAQQARHADWAARCRAHPEHVVVAPFDVQVMVVAERVHDEVGAGSPVVYVAEDVELVDGQALDQVAQGDDEVVRAAGRDDRVDDDVEIGLLVVVLDGLVKQFLYYI